MTKEEQIDLKKRLNELENALRTKECELEKAQQENNFFRKKLKFEDNAFELERNNLIKEIRSRDEEIKNLYEILTKIRLYEDDCDEASRKIEDLLQNIKRLNKITGARCLEIQIKYCDTMRLRCEENDPEADDKLLSMERKLKESERENVLLREKLGTIQQVEWERKEAEEKIHAMHKEIDAMNEYIFELKQSLAAQRKINEAWALGKADCTEQTGCKKVRWEAD